jgi:hypothetical protein
MPQTGPLAAAPVSPGTTCRRILTVEAWLRRHPIEDADTTAVLDHLWPFMTVTPETFQDWYDWQPAAQLAAEAGSQLPSSAATECSKHEATLDDPAMMLADVVNIVYDSLLGALDLSRSMTRLRDLAAVAGRSDVSLPDEAHVRRLTASQRHGWGNPASPAQLAKPCARDPR